MNRKFFNKVVRLIGKGRMYPVFFLFLNGHAVRRFPPTFLPIRSHPDQFARVRTYVVKVWLVVVYSRYIYVCVVYSI